MGINQNIILSQRGNLLIILGLIVLISIVGVGAYYFGANKKAENTSLTSAIQRSPSPSPIQANTSEFSSNELNGFPVTLKLASSIRKNNLPVKEKQVDFPLVVLLPILGKQKMITIK